MDQVQKNTCVSWDEVTIKVKARNWELRRQGEEAPVSGEVRGGGEKNAVFETAFFKLRRRKKTGLGVPRQLKVSKSKGRGTWEKGKREWGRGLSKGRGNRTWKNLLYPSSWETNPNDL